MHGPTCTFWANLTPFSLQYDKLHLCHYGDCAEKDYFGRGDHLCTFEVSHAG
jgi:hypothetical protein